MKTTGITALLAALALSGCTKSDIAAPTTPLPTPAASTPHPALAARTQAIRLYPALARKGSVFNQAFREIYEHRKKHDPASLTSPEWPTTIAHRTASLLGEKSALPGKTSPAQKVGESKKNATPLNQTNPLNQAAHSQKRAFVDTDRDGRAFDFNQPSR